MEVILDVVRGIRLATLELQQRDDFAAKRGDVAIQIRLQCTNIQFVALADRFSSRYRHAEVLGRWESGGD